MRKRSSGMMPENTCREDSVCFTVIVLQMV